jgi:hypothetical protein
MINQIASIPQKTTPLAPVNRGLVQARHIQAHVRSLAHEETRPETGRVSSPLTGLPYLVPILRWID